MIAFLILIVEPFIFYKIQLLEYQNDFIIFSIFRVILIILLFICLVLILVSLVGPFYEYFDKPKFAKRKQLILTLFSIIVLLSSLVPIFIISKVIDKLNYYKTSMITSKGNIAMAYIHFAKNEYFTHRNGSSKGKPFTNYFDLRNSKGEIYELEFREYHDIFKPGDSIKVQFLQSNPNYFVILEKFPSDPDNLD